MNPKTTVRDGNVEVEIDGTCEYSRFKDAATVLEKQFDVRFTRKLDNLENSYWNFIYKGSELTLHFNHYCGTSLLVKPDGASTINGNENVQEIGTLLHQRLNGIS